MSLKELAMIRPIVTSELMLRLPSEPATTVDAQVGQDLLDTLTAHTEECVGMAANMIGVRKRVIVAMDGQTPLLMFNPTIEGRSGEYKTQEGCLSLPGQRPTTRWRSITVSYLGADFHPRKRLFQGYVAQIIQHEIDHCDGIVI